MKILIIVVGLFTSLAAGAQDSLSHYLSLAAKNNPVVLQKYHEYQAALQKVPQVGSLPDPTLSMGVFLSPMELVGGNQVADIQLMQMFPWFGTLRAAKDEMSLMANARFEEFRDAKLQAFYDVQKAFFELYRLKQRVRISEKNIGILQSIERLSLIKFKAVSSAGSNIPSPGTMQEPEEEANSGTESAMAAMKSGSGRDAAGQSGQAATVMQGSAMNATSGNADLIDLYRIQIEIGDLQNSIALIRNQQNTVLARFNGYLNRPALTPVFLPDTLSLDTIETSLFTPGDSMLSGTPMLGMLQYEQQSLESRKKMVTRMGFPMIGLGLNYSLINASDMSTSEMNGKDMIMPMVSVTLPIYRKKYKAMRMEADLLESAMEQNYLAAAINLRTEYYQAIQLYEDALRRVRLYTDQHVLMSKSLNILKKNYAASGSDLIEVLRLQQQALGYEQRQIEAMADLYTAVAGLKRVMASTQSEL